MDHDKMMVDLLDTLSAAIEDSAELKAENAELKKQNDVTVKQWSADLKTSRERMSLLRAENDDLKDRIEDLHEKITRDSREAFGVMAQLNAENNELITQIEAIKATDPAKVIDALLADKTNLKYALSSIVSIVKVAEQL